MTKCVCVSKCVCGEEKKEMGVHKDVGNSESA